MTEKNLEKRNQKLRKAIEHGARMVEISLSKVAWDIGHDKVKAVSGKLDYRAHQILDCAADKIAQGYWFSQVFRLKDSATTKEPDDYIVVIEAHEFKNFVENQTLTSKYLIKIFKDLAMIILDGEELNIPYCLSENRWLILRDFIDNICGVAIAYEREEYEKYRSDRKLRGKGAKTEEPVFIILFSSPYGKSFFRNAMHRAGTQIQDPELYALPPKTQELFQSIRWKRDLIILDPEQISKTVGWKWPPSNISKRVGKCRRLLKILYERNFINEVTERGKKIGKKDWVFYTRKRKLIKKEV